MTNMTNDKILTLINVYANGIEYNRFNYCQAWISEKVFNSAYNVTFRLIKSYDTIVGFINLDTKQYIELGKWSKTTSKQITQIYNSMFNDYKREFINLYY